MADLLTEQEKLDSDAAHAEDMPRETGSEHLEFLRRLRRTLQIYVPAMEGKIVDDAHNAKSTLNSWLNGLASDEIRAEAVAALAGSFEAASAHRGTWTNLLATINSRYGTADAVTAMVAAVMEVNPDLNESEVRAGLSALNKAVIRLAGTDARTVQQDLADVVAAFAFLQD